MFERCQKSVSRFSRIAALGMAAAFLCSGVACEQKHTFVPPPPPGVTVCKPVQKAVNFYSDFTGNTQAVNTVQLVARVEGYLEQVLFKDGDMVKKGQSLFIIQQDTYQAKVQQAEATLATSKAQLEYADTEFARFSQLFKQNAAAATDVSNWKYQRDSAQASVSSAQANLVLAKLNLGYTKVTAPFTGRIDRRLKDPGNLVGTGGNTALANINQIDPIYVYFTINENDLLNVLNKKRKDAGIDDKEPDLPVMMGLAEDEGFPHEGRFDFASISLDPQSGTLLLRASFPNPDGSVLPGMFARLRVPSLKKTDVIMVPEIAIGADQLGRYVLVVDEKNIVERRGIREGNKVDDYRVIKKGLKGDEWVVVNGLLEAIPGHPVNPARQQTPDEQSGSKAIKGS